MTCPKTNNKCERNDCLVECQSKGFIYLHPVDGFTFLENVPEKPIEDNYPNYQGYRYDLDLYERALAECIEKRMVIGNPEVIGPLLNLQLGEGKFRPWVGTYEIKEEMYMTMPPKPTGYKVVTLIAPEKPTNFCSTFDRIKEEKLSTENSGFSIESKVCEKCGSVLKTEFHKGLRIQKVEPVNSSMSYPEPWSNWPKNENEQINFFLVNILRLLNGEQAMILAKNILERLPSEPVVSQDQEEPFEVIANFLHSSGLVFNTDKADLVARDLINYLKDEGVNFSRKPID